MILRHGLLFSCFVLIGAAALGQQHPITPAPRNLDFAEGPAGQLPPGWFAGPTGYTAVATTEGAKSARCATVKSDAAVSSSCGPT